MKKTCSRCYQKFEEEDMVLNKSDAYSFCIECHKEYKKEKQKENEERKKKLKEDKKEVQEVKHPLLKALFPYFLTTSIAFLIVVGFHWWIRVKQESHCGNCNC